ncbi:LacI family DNA-binding transcriptional regulator [Streptomyces sp. NPDC006682]|uniref:LacI family DNA-binding transcriptional regulator n=1 Tax=unclassified Streptomyces TaxID=2593676 RepID=UPI0034522F08
MARQTPAAPSSATQAPECGLNSATDRAGVARRRIGIKDVAREAGVSLGTVSNVLNRPEIVAESTRRRVLGVIGSIGYVRAEGARQLHGLTSRVIAVLGLDVAGAHFSALTTGVQQTAREADLGVMMCTGASDAEEESRQLALITAHQLRGAVLIGTEVSRTVAAFRQYAVPFVMADHCAAEPATCSVGVDDVAGGFAAVRHLLEQGHRTLAYVGGPDRTPMRDRRTGARRAVSRSGLSSASLHELACPALTVSAGNDAGHRILGLPVRPTAVFCGDDLLALGVMQVLYEAGLKVPDDIAMVGYDDLEFAASAVVPLTTVPRPAVAMGRHAGRLLIEHTGLDAGHEHAHVILQPELVVRRSTLPSTAL